MDELTTCEQFEQELRDALSHLYDPDYQPSEILCALAGCDSSVGPLAFQTQVIRAIESLEPVPGTPAAAHTRRVYDVLHNRFVLKLTQEETADRLHMSRSTINRAQREAVHTLAGVIWDRSQGDERVTEDPSQRSDTHPTLAHDASSDQAPNWRSQMQRELASLQEKAPNAVSDVRDVVGTVLNLIGTRTSELGVQVEVRSVQAGLVAAVHPVVLQQVLIALTERLARRITGGEVAVYARLEDGNARITLTGDVAPGAELDNADLVDGIPAASEVSVEVCVDDAHAFVWVEMPSVGKITVLVVDDNEDMARFYRGSAVGTRYHIVHTAQGLGLFDIVGATAPDVIVLDVMLPDIDGWRLLMRLREDPATRSVPVIVCSVVREDALALSLGAARFLSKPVRPREFIEALDQVLPPVAARVPKAPVSSE